MTRPPSVELAVIKFPDHNFTILSSNTYEMYSKFVEEFIKKIPILNSSPDHGSTMLDDFHFIQMLSFQLESLGNLESFSTDKENVI